MARCDRYILRRMWLKARGSKKQARRERNVAVYTFRDFMKIALGKMKSVKRWQRAPASVR